MALGAAAHCAKECIQLLGGIGFTWEHDAHFYLKRAMANLQLFAAGDVGALEHEVADLAIAGARRNLAADLPSEAESLRAEIRAVVAEVAAADAAEQRVAFAEAGLIMPHWPAPWGRGASPLEQLVIDEELAAAGLAAAAPGRRRLGPAHDHRPRHARAAGALGAARRCTGSSTGASSSASPAPAPTWPR